MVIDEGVLQTRSTQAAQLTEQESVIGARMADLNHMTQTVLENIIKLRAKLKPVILDKVEAEVRSEAGVNGSCPLSEDLYEQVIKLVRINKIIDYILDCIEI
jgi:hypothetical protein